jgi:hypothetical protein
VDRAGEHLVRRAQLVGTQDANGVPGQVGRPTW